MRVHVVLAPPCVPITCSSPHWWGSIPFLGLWGWPRTRHRMWDRWNRHTASTILRLFLGLWCSSASIWCAVLLRGKFIFTDRICSFSLNLRIHVFNSQTSLDIVTLIINCTASSLISPGILVRHVLKLLCSMSFNPGFIFSESLYSSLLHADDSLTSVFQFTVFFLLLMLICYLICLLWFLVQWLFLISRGTVWFFSRSLCSFFTMSSFIWISKDFTISLLIQNTLTAFLRLPCHFAKS